MPLVGFNVYTHTHTHVCVWWWWCDDNYAFVSFVCTDSERKHAPPFLIFRVSLDIHVYVHPRLNPCFLLPCMHSLVRPSMCGYEPSLSRMFAPHTGIRGMHQYYTVARWRAGFSEYHGNLRTGSARRRAESRCSEPGRGSREPASQGAPYKSPDRRVSRDDNNTGPRCDVEAGGR